MFKILILFFFLDGSPYAKIDLSRLKVMADLLWKATSWNRFLVANSNSSFYYGWSLSLSVCHITLQNAHAPVTYACAFATRGFQTLLFLSISVGMK